MTLGPITTRRLAPLAAAATLALGLGGCEIADGGENLVNGKKQFVAKCGACHILARANSTGVSGPNLDEAFRVARQQGFGESTFEGMVKAQIAEPNPNKQLDPETLKRTALMPADLVTGEDAEDVAAYVGRSAGRKGEDTGQLALIGPKKSTDAAKAENGELAIPADPSGALLYTFATAEAEAGPLKLLSINESSVPHNIAVEGNGVNLDGPVVQGGGTSEVSGDFKPGEYTFFCSVPGHRQGGMEGKLLIK